MSHKGSDGALRPVSDGEVTGPGGRLGVDLGPADVLGGGVCQVAVDDGVAVEPHDGGQASADGGPGQVPLLLHPAGVQLDVGATNGEDLEAHLGAPGELGPPVAGEPARVLPE